MSGIFPFRQFLQLPLRCRVEVVPIGIAECSVAQVSGFIGAPRADQDCDEHAGQAEVARTCVSQLLQVSNDLAVHAEPDGRLPARDLNGYASLRETVGVSHCEWAAVGSGEGRSVNLLASLCAVGRR